MIAALYITHINRRMLDPTKKRHPTCRGQKRSHSKMAGGAKSHLESHPIPTRDVRGLKQTLCAPGPRAPTETEPGLCLSVSCGGVGQQ